MRRKIDIFFLSIAGILLFIHSIVPHHHHGQACKEHSHVNSCDIDHDNDCDDLQDCSLKDIFARLTVKLSGSPEERFENTDCIVNNTLELLPKIQSISVLYKSVDINSFYQDYISISKGLRAPPMSC